MKIRQNYGIQKFLLSDPDHMIFVYSPQTRHIRLLELQKKSVSFPNLQNFHFHTYHHFEPQFKFIPKRCFLLDEKLTIIQKQSEGKPLNYKKKYKKEFNKFISSKIFNWYTGNQKYMVNIQQSRSYLFYPEITSFCFGRRHFVRGINSVQIASDLISRDHCQILVKEGYKKQQLKDYLVKVFKLNFYRNKANLLQLLSTEIWQKIFQFLHCTNQRYYINDTGSRNGTYYIEAYSRITKDKKNSTQNLTYKQDNLQISHQVLIKAGYSYQFEGQEFIIKIWKTTEEFCFSQLVKKYHLNQQDFQCSLSDPVLKFKMKSCQLIRQFEEDINWYDHYQKVKKQLIIDEQLLEIFKEDKNLQHYQYHTDTKNQMINIIIQEYQQLKKEIKSKKQRIQVQSQQYQKNKHKTLQEEDTTQTYFIQKYSLHVMILSLEYNNDRRKLFCLITKQGKAKHFHVGANMVIDTQIYGLYSQQANKCNGFVAFDGYKWKLCSLNVVQKTGINPQINSTNKINKRNDSDSQNSQVQADYESSQQQNNKNKIVDSQVSLKSHIQNHIWTKIPTSHPVQLKPSRCKKYILRLSHSFYFQLKFINFHSEKHLQIQKDN